jgi:hypothetical protein
MSFWAFGICTHKICKKEQKSVGEFYRIASQPYFPTRPNDKWKKPMCRDGTFVKPKMAYCQLHFHDGVAQSEH